jgi:polysaccharide biosynthesis/export protein
MKSRLLRRFTASMAPMAFAIVTLVLLAACTSIDLGANGSDGDASGAAIPTVAPPAPAIAANDPAYVIGPEDGLEIAVWKDESLKATTLVRPDGGISFPLLGDIVAAGKTAAQLRTELTKRLEKFVPEPFVNVSVVRVASYRFYVLGRVNKPGDFVAGRNVDVLQALSLAGGLTPFADEDAIRIIRQVDGKKVSIPFEYSRVRRSGDLSQNITLRSGDVLLVP